MAWRNSGVPLLGVYLVKPVSMAACAAALMCSGVSKSGSPAPKPQTSMPSAFMALALLSMERVSEGVSEVAREESSIGLFVVGLLIADIFFDERLQVVFLDFHDAHLADRVFGGVGGVGGIDHDGLAKFLADGAGGSL